MCYYWVNSISGRRGEAASGERDTGSAPARAWPAVTAAMVIMIPEQIDLDFESVPLSPRLPLPEITVTLKMSPKKPKR